MSIWNNCCHRRKHARTANAQKVRHSHHQLCQWRTGIYLRNGGVEFVSEITDTDIRKFYDAKVSLSVTYTINVFATKDGYDNSEVATATLCWIESDPKKEGVGEDKITELNALPVLIQTQDGNITIQGLEKVQNAEIMQGAKLQQLQHLQQSKKRHKVLITI